MRTETTSKQSREIFKYHDLICCRYYKLEWNKNTLRFLLQKGNAEKEEFTQNEVLDEIRVLRADYYKDHDSGCIITNDQETYPIEVKYIDQHQMLTIRSAQGKQLLFQELRSLYIYNSKKEYNLCNPSVRTNSKSYQDKLNRYTIFTQSTVNLTDTMEWWFQYLENGIFRFRVRRVGLDPWEVNDIVDEETLRASETNVSQMVEVAENKQPFYFKLKDKPDGEVILKSSESLESWFIFTDYFKKLSLDINTTSEMFGLGERTGDFWLKDGTYSLWSYDQEATRENGRAPGKNLGGVHPVIFNRLPGDDDTRFMAIFSLNSNAQDFIIKNRPDNFATVTEITTGGIFEMYVILPDTIDNVLAKYHRLIKTPFLPPLWTFGWHQSSSGYKSTGDMLAVLSTYENTNFPLESMWVDVDYMDNYKDFTIDPENFKDLKEFVDNLHGKNKKFVPVVDGSISLQRDYEPYQRGLSEGVYVRSGADENRNFEGRDDSGDVVYPDWTKESCENWWINELKEFKKKIAFDGMWLDRNEPRNIYDGAHYSKLVVLK